MKKFEVIFRNNDEEQTTIFLGANKQKALSAFLIKHPSLSEQDVISVEPLSQPSFLDTASEHASSYETARKVSMFVSFLGWIMLAFGAIALVIGLFSDSGYRGSILLNMVPGFALALSGLLLVAGGQVTRATVDNADNTREILNTLKGQP